MIWLLVLLSTAMADYKVIYNHNGRQGVLYLEDYSKFIPQPLVDELIWDESKRGKLPADRESKLGGWKLVGRVLTFDQTLKDAFDAAESAKAAERAERESKTANKIAAAKSCITKINDDTITNAELKTCLGGLIKYIIRQELTNAEL